MEKAKNLRKLIAVGLVGASLGIGGLAVGNKPLVHASVARITLKAPIKVYSHAFKGVKTFKKGTKLYYVEKPYGIVVSTSPKGTNLSKGDVVNSEFDRDFPGSNKYTSHDGQYYKAFKGDKTRNGAGRYVKNAALGEPGDNDKDSNSRKAAQKGNKAKKDNKAGKHGLAKNNAMGEPGNNDKDNANKNGKNGDHGNGNHANGNNNAAHKNLPRTSEAYAGGGFIAGIIASVLAMFGYAYVDGRIIKRNHADK